MLASTLIASAKGKLDLEKAFKWTKEEILAFIKAVAEDPKGHGVQEQNHIADKSHDLNTAIKEAAGIIEGLAAAGTAFDPTLHIPDSKVPDTYFDDFPLPAGYTIFDCLGWILSLTAYPSADVTEVTEANFFLPLAAVFHKWCLVIIPKKFAPAMTHISYWNDVTDGGILMTLLGSTPGSSLAFEGLEGPESEAAKKGKKPVDKSPRSHIIIRNRQDDLKEIGIPAPDPAAQEVTKEGAELNIGYGRCAETMFYIWAGSYVKYQTDKARQPKVNGFALEPKHNETSEKAFKATASYDPAGVKEAVVEPCTPSCKTIMLAKMKSAWEWEPDFSSKKVPRAAKVKVIDKSAVKA